MYYYGIDIGGTKIKIGLFAEEKLISRYEIPTNTNNNGEHLFFELAKKIEEINLDNNIDKTDINGFGFGVPGPVENNTVTECINIGIVNLDVKKKWQEYFEKAEVIVKNDADLATYGEYAYRDQNKDIAMMTIGTGIGGGIVIDDKLYFGNNGNSGYIGHIKVNSNINRKCNCGDYNCLETFSSATGILKTYQEYLSQSNLSTEGFTTKDVFDLAKNGDSVAYNIVDEATKKIAYAISSIVAVTGIDEIIIGGGVSKAGEFLLNLVNKHFKENYTLGNVNIELSKLGDASGMYGAANLVQKQTK